MIFKQIIETYGWRWKLPYDDFPCALKFPFSDFSLLLYFGIIYIQECLVLNIIILIIYTKKYLDSKAEYLQSVNGNLFHSQKGKD